MACVPTGALVIHPQTGRPLMNPDGSVYYFDPNNPPILYDPGEFEEVEPTKTVDQNSEKRRGRLEKQHSFIDHEVECQQAEQYHYEYEVQETQENFTEKEPPKPVTPTKRYEPSVPQEKQETNQTPEATDTANQRAFEPTNQREVKAGSYQDTVYYGPYASLNNQPYNEEVQTPPQMAQYVQQDVTNINVKQATTTPVLQDPNMRPMALNTMYQSNIPHGYQYVPNPAQCRVDPLQQQLIRYQSATLLQQQIEEQKVPTPPQQIQDNTFRIDPSYPYAPVDYTSTYPAGCEPMQNQPQPQRSYSVPYNPAEIPLAGAMPPVYPLGNVMQPQLIQYPMQYQEAVQWTPVQTPTMCPVVYPQHYPHYNILYPQVVPQPYPICQPVYSMLDTRRKRNSLPSSARVTPIITPEEKPYEKFDRQNSEIAAKINQIKEGMMQRDGMNRRRDDWKRNSGNGILGSYPINYNGRMSGASDKVHLTPTARAIVDSLRHLQARNTYQGRRYDYNYRNYDRPDYRRRYDRDDINGRGDSNYVDRHNKDYQDKHSHNTDKNSQITDKDSHTTDNNSQITDKNSHTTDSNSHNDTNTPTYTDVIGDASSFQDNGNTIDKSNAGDNQDKVSQSKHSVQDIQGSNGQDITQSNVPDRNKSYAQDITVPNHGHVRTQRNVQDRTPNNVVDKTVPCSIPDIAKSHNTDKSQSSVINNQSTIQERTSVVTNRTQNTVTNITQSNVPDRTQSVVPDRTVNNAPKWTQINVTDGTQSNSQGRLRSNAPEWTPSNISNRTVHSNVLNKTQSNVQDRTQSSTPEWTQSNVPDRTIQSNVLNKTQSNVQDRTVHSNALNRSQSTVQDRTQSYTPEWTQSNITDRAQCNIPDRTQSNIPDRTVQSNVLNRTQSTVQDRTQSSTPEWTQSNVTDRTQSNIPDRTVQSNVLNRSQSNVQDRTQSNTPEWNQSNVSDRTQSNIPDRTVHSNVLNRSQSIVQDRTQSNTPEWTQSNVPDRTQNNIPDRTVHSNVLNRSQSTVQDRTQSNTPEWNQSNVSDRTQSNIPDRTVQSNVLNRTQSNAGSTQDRSSYHERTISQETRQYQDRGTYQDSRNYQENRNYHDRTGYHDRSHQDRGHQDRGYQDRGNQHDRPWPERKFGPRPQTMNPGQYQFRPPYLLRQMSPATWCRRSPAPVHPGVPHPRRPFPENRGRRY